MDTISFVSKHHPKRDKLNIANVYYIWYWFYKRLLKKDKTNIISASFVNFKQLTLYDRINL